jgi:cell division protein FtsN
MPHLLNRTGASRTDTIVKLVLILFISLLSFSVGTYVGKQVSDNDHRRAQIEGDYKDVAGHDAGGVGEHGNGAGNAAKEGEEKLSDDEIASLTEEFVTKERQNTAQTEEPDKKREVASAHEESAGYKKFNQKGQPEPVKAETPAAAHESAKLHETPKKTTTAKVETTHSDVKADLKAEPKVAAPGGTGTKAMAMDPGKVAERIADGHTPTPDPKEERKPLSVLPTVAATAVGKYTIQVASYPDEPQAKDHAANLKGKGWNAFYIPAEVAGKMWYRVSVGLFTSAKSAAEFRKEFQKETNVATAIVQKIVK